MTLRNWNKSRLVRVSRLVADLHGSSLIINTGFSTSLLDLLLKNRDRFNKRSTTRPSSPHHHHRYQGLPLPEELSPAPSSPMADEASGNKILFLGPFKVFVILGLALGVAQFAWAMAAAAFSLISLEFLGKSRAERFCHLKEPKKEEIVDSEREYQITKVKVIESDNPMTALPEKKAEREPSTDRRRESKSITNLIKKLVKRKLRHGKKREQISSVIVESPTEDRIEETRNRCCSRRTNYWESESRDEKKFRELSVSAGDCSLPNSCTFRRVPG